MGILKKAVIRSALLLCAAAVFFSGCERVGKEPVVTVISNSAPVTAEKTDAPENAVSETHTAAPVDADDEKYADVPGDRLCIPEHMSAEYASLSFNKRMSDAYYNTLSALLSFKDSVPMPLTISNVEYWNVLETMRCEQFMLFFVDSRSLEQNPVTGMLEMTFTYKYSVKETNIMLMETENAAKKIVDMTDENMSDYEKLKFFHDYLVLNTESDDDNPYADSVYGALVQKKALCEGFAKAFSYLCNLAGIENMIVTGYTSVDHMWNMVKLEDNWYHVDVGWDQPADILRQLYPDMILYQYFLADDKVMENNRIISGLMSPPAADSDEYSYFRYEHRYASDYGQALAVIKEACGKCVDSGEKYFMLKLDTSNLYLQTTAGLIRQDERGESDIDRIVSDLNFSGKISYIDYYKSYRIIIFVLE